MKALLVNGPKHGTVVDVAPEVESQKIDGCVYGRHSHTLMHTGYGLVLGLAGSTVTAENISDATRIARAAGNGFMPVVFVGGALHGTSKTIDLNIADFQHGGESFVKHGQTKAKDVVYTLFVNDACNTLEGWEIDDRIQDALSKATSLNDPA